MFESKLKAYLAITAGLCIVAGLIVTEYSLTRSSKESGPLLGASSKQRIDMPLENESLAFEKKTLNIHESSECFPVHVGSENRVGVFYLHCSPEALKRDRQSKRISESFVVPESLASRFNFWKRIYTIWGKEQYAMHMSEHPEVILEIYDGSSLPESMTTQEKDKFLRKFSIQRRDRYREIFRSLHAQRRNPESFSPAMRRVAQLMSHIDDKDKFDRAVWRMRIQKGQRDYIAQGLPTSSKYMQRIEAEFADVGVPIELAKIAFVESSFNLKAMSKVGASGVFQIMPSTGRQYLMMRDGIDERNDPIKAARASAKLLKLNHKILGEWPLAITAYNHGVGSMKRGTRRVGSNDISDLIEEYSAASFGFASKNFYTSYLAILDAMQEVDRHYPDVKLEVPLAFDEVRLAKSTSLKKIAIQYKVSVSKLAELNPDLGRTFIRSSAELPRGYVIKIPSNSETELAEPRPVDPNKRLTKSEGDRS